MDVSHVLNHDCDNASITDQGEYVPEHVAIMEDQVIADMAKLKADLDAAKLKPDLRDEIMAAGIRYGR